jgi:very-short-patch-repair endonuclease
MYKDGKLPLFLGEKNPMYNKKPWNLDLNKNNSEIIFNYGKKISIFKKNEWISKSVDDKKKVIDRLNQAMIQTRKPTKIEIKIKNLLDEYKINFKKNHKLNGFLCDFYLCDYNLVIECDGDYWHGNPKFYKLGELSNIQLKNKNRDIRKNNMLLSNSIFFLRFWEYDIHNNFDDVKEIILKKINL